MTPIITYAFGPFLFTPRRQLLLKGGEAVRIGCRALDLLTAFVQRPNEVLTKSELIDEAWPDTTVVEGNLKVHIAALRRALDDDADQARYIATVSGRGYRFIEPISAINMPTAISLPASSQLPKIEAEAPRPGHMEARFREVISLLAQTMRSAVLDLSAGTEPGGNHEVPRRVLCIELGARDEAWIERMFAQRQEKLPATR